MRHLDLFSGIGGFALAARWVGWETVAFCEPDEYCRAVLRKHWPDVPIHPDVRELKADAVGPVDIITGGYPCQPFSIAGKRRGTGDDRHLWPEFARLIRELRPRWAVGENVAGHITMGLDEVLSDLEGLGYTWEAFVIPAVAVDAQHRRDRLWIIADANGERGWQEQIGKPRCGNPSESRDDGETGIMAQPDSDRNERRRASGEHSAGAGPSHASTGPDQRSDDVADSHRAGLRKQRRTEPVQEKFSAAERGCRWEPEPDVGRVADGVSNRVDRIKALGNAIVPQIAEVIFRAIDSDERDNS